MHLVTKVGWLLVAAGTACLGVVDWINKTTPILSDPSKIPLFLLLLGVGLLYAGLRWASFGAQLRRLSAPKGAGPAQ